MFQRFSAARNFLWLKYDHISVVTHLIHIIPVLGFLNIVDSLLMQKSCFAIAEILSRFPLK
ncbi:hypothetical protein BS333_02575 [Vibrio azureus]|nr:hypothetical protein BS333_02575 [Vibrio azureus]